MYLVLQITAPLGRVSDRVVYVFGCNNKECKQQECSVLRTQSNTPCDPPQPNETDQQPKQQQSTWASVVAKNMDSNQDNDDWWGHEPSSG